MEAMNGLFQAARARARGYRNTETFITMIYLIAARLGDGIKSTSNVEEQESIEMAVGIRAIAVDPRISNTAHASCLPTSWRAWEGAVT